jgi:hypothetical protein
MEKEFKYKSGEYANKLGISKEALRSRRRRGELENEYIIQRRHYPYGKNLRLFLLKNHMVQRPPAAVRMPVVVLP